MSEFAHLGLWAGAILIIGGAALAFAGYHLIFYTIGFLIWLSVTASIFIVLAVYAFPGQLNVFQCILLGVFSFACGVVATIFGTRKLQYLSSALLGATSFLAIAFLLVGLVELTDFYWALAIYIISGTYGFAITYYCAKGT